MFWARDLHSWTNLIVKVWNDKGVMHKAHQRKSWINMFVWNAAVTWRPQDGMQLCLYLLQKCLCWHSKISQKLLDHKSSSNTASTNVYDEFNIDNIWIEWTDIFTTFHRTLVLIPTPSILDVTGDSWRLRYQVALVPGIAFGNPKCLRLSYAATKENITETRKDTALKKVYLRGFGGSMLYLTGRCASG